MEKREKNRSSLARTLIVGLGGRGSEIVGLVAKKVKDDQRSKLGFVLFDTDANEIGTIESNNGLVRKIQTSQNLTVKQYLAVDKQAASNWFPKHHVLDVKTVTEGAGQVRAISRLALNTAIRVGSMQALEKAIQHLYKLTDKNEEQALRVIIVSTLAGGTGSGLILPVSMYIRDFVNSRLQKNACIIRGFFIMPDVMYDVVTGETERNNLKANAYATIRELEAFQRGKDGIEPIGRYSSLKFEVPSTTSNDSIELETRPFDFCFLFDKSNLRNTNIDKFDDRLQHAADCIYAQAIGPMNARSNSSEDNTIRDLIGSGGRNRYCGAGTSRLEYPRKDILDYVSLNWAKKVVSEKWLFFDNEIKSRLSDLEDQKEKGFPVPEFSEMTLYTELVEQANIAKSNDFARKIMNDSYTTSGSGDQKTGRWVDYLSGLRNFIENKSFYSQGGLEDLFSAASTQVEHLSGIDWTQYNNVKQSLEKLYKSLVMRIDDQARSVSYQIFKSRRDFDECLNDETQIEKYLTDEKNNFFHPNTVRYILYKLVFDLDISLKAIKDSLREKESNFSDDLKAIKGMDNSNPNRPQPQLSDRKPTIVQKITNDASPEQLKQKALFDSFYTNLVEYRNQYVLHVVYEEAQNYITKLAESYGTFYKSFETNVRLIESNINRIEQNYQISEGIPVRYVCASKICLSKLLESMPFTSSNVSLNTDICAGIFNEVKVHSKLIKNTEDSKKKAKSGKYFLETFQNVIMENFKDQVSKAYPEIINQDIISALQKEAEYEHELTNPDSVKEYINECIKAALVLAEPFIERPISFNSGSVIRSCVYNSSVFGDDVSSSANANNKLRQDIVKGILSENGGIPNDEFDDNMIIFYQAIYGLSVSDMARFLPKNPDKAVPTDGQYFSAYQNLISKLTPDTEKNTVVTPHIDKNWHIITKLPELDSEFQRKVERNIYRAFFNGLVFGKIQFDFVSSTKKLYRVYIDIEAFDMIVSNGTPCDSFYEIHDALTINPVLVKSIENSIQKEIRDENDRKIPFTATSFIRGMNKLKLEEFSEYDKLSFFDLPTLLKISTPSSKYLEADGAEFMLAIIEEIIDFTSAVLPKDEVGCTLNKFVREQFEIYKTNLSIHKVRAPESLGSIANRTIRIVASKMKDFEQYDLHDYMIQELARMNQTQELVKVSKN
jgi:hypothetical protein